MTARTVDLGTGGARVTSDRPLRVDEELRFDVALCDEAEHVVGTGRVLRQDGHNVYALRFERVAPECARDLQSFLDASPPTRLH